MQTFIDSKTIEFYPASEGFDMIFPLFAGISAGFPSPAADFIDVAIDLRKEIIRNPSSTFLGRIKGNSMRDAGIDDGNIIVVDKSLKCTDNCIAVCFLDGEFTVKRIKMGKDGCWLVAENEQYKPIQVTAENEFVIWGIVTSVIKFF